MSIAIDRLWPNAIELSGISEHQREQAAIAMSAPIGMISGPPGTGKTTLAAAILRACASKIGIHNIAVAASTGKAALRLTQGLIRNGVSLEAATCHRTLGVNRNGHDGKGWGFTYGRDLPLPAKILLLEEASMNDTDIAANMFCALRQGAHCLLVGDYYQLPPVGHGAPLRDFTAAGIPFGELTEIHRNAGLIVEACKAIKEDRPFEGCDALDPDRGQNYKHLECPRNGESLNQLFWLLKNIPAKWNPVWDVQVLCAVNEKSELGRVLLNQKLQALLNPKQIDDTLWHRFLPRDKVVCLENGYLPQVKCVDCGSDKWEEFGFVEKQGYYCEECAGFIRPSEMTQEFVANGEIGRVVHTGTSTMHVETDFPRRVLRISGENHKRFDLAYALSCHKSQGSQWPVVITMIDEYAGAKWVTSKEWVYTALSRAESVSFTVGRKRTLNSWCQRSALADRKTFLTSLIHDSGI